MECDVQEYDGEYDPRQRNHRAYAQWAVRRQDLVCHNAEEHALHDIVAEVGECGGLGTSEYQGHTAIISRCGMTHQNRIVTRGRATGWRGV